MLLARRERRHRPVERHAERHARKEGFEPVALLAPVDHRRRVGAAGDEILRRRQRGHEGEMLIDHADAEGLRVARIFHRDFGSVEKERSLVGRIEAHHTFDERRLARAVFAQKRVKRARRHIDGDVVERGEPPERLGHPHRFERGSARRRRGRMGERESVGHGRESPGERTMRRMNGRLVTAGSRSRPSSPRRRRIRRPAW